MMLKAGIAIGTTDAATASPVVGNILLTNGMPKIAKLDLYAPCINAPRLGLSLMKSGTITEGSSAFSRQKAAQKIINFGSNAVLASAL